MTLLAVNLRGKMVAAYSFFQTWPGRYQVVLYQNLTYANALGVLYAAIHWVQIPQSE